MFAGCNLIEINKQKYYNEAVVVVSLKEGYGDAYNAYEKTYTKIETLGFDGRAAEIARISGGGNITEDV